MKEKTAEEMAKEVNENIDAIKEIVVDQCAKEPAERDLFEAFGALIDKIEASIEEEGA